MLIDINIDIGEGFNNEAKLIPLVSSCNIACGGHAGDLNSIEEVVKIAKKNQVQIGAHPSFNDKVNFGRIPMEVSSSDLYSQLLTQIKRVVNVAVKHQISVAYIKPHGALYHMVCNEAKYANVLLDIICLEMPNIKLMGLPDCIAEELAMKRHVGFIREGFADRVYEPDGSLRNRKLQNSVLALKESILDQFLKISKKQPLQSSSGKEIIVDVDSICFHGDHDCAVENIEFVVNSMKDNDLQFGI